MNSTQAKKLSLPDLLSRLGYSPEKITKGGYEYWYCSPFRSESEPSFHTSFLGGKWIWNDFGDIGGTVIDFVMRHENYTRVSEALAFLDSLYGQAPALSAKKQHSLFAAKPRNKPENPILILERIEPLKASLKYLVEERKLAENICKKYLEEIYFSNSENNRSYFAAGIKNRAGGYEIRNPYFKSCIGKKDICFIPASQTAKEVAVFEGFIDFLSFLTDNKQEQAGCDVIILNSVSFGEIAIELIKQSNYEQILTFFDNDKAGEAEYARFKDSLGQGAVQAMNHLYKNYRDYNEKLTSIKK